MTTQERIKAYSEVSENGCWVWTRPLNRDGYGQSWDGEKHGYAHRISYIAFVGPVPEGMQLDHLCRNPACVNPDHLEPVTWAENQRRGVHGMKTTCVNGHAYTPENTYLRPIGSLGHRDCRACIRDRVRRYQARRKAA